MGGCTWENDMEMGAASDPNVVNIVLVGKTGNGKSATANSILRKKAFSSKSTFAAVTTKSEQQKTQFDGRTLNVIDTPGLFDAEYDSEYISGEIARCISMAKDGIHAVLIVLSLSRFTKEEGAVVEQLQSIFGREICDYVIVVFTHGDDLDDDETLDDRLAGSPRDLKSGVQRLLSEKWKSSEKKNLKDEIKAELLEKMWADAKQEQMQTLTFMILTKLSSLEDKLTDSNARVTCLESELKSAKDEGKRAEEKRELLKDEIRKLKDEMKAKADKERAAEEKAKAEKKSSASCTIM